MAVHEVLMVDKEIRKMIAGRTSVEEIYEYAASVQKIVPLKSNIADLVKQGITTADEFVRLTYGE